MALTYCSTQFDYFCFSASDSVAGSKCEVVDDSAAIWSTQVEVHVHSRESPMFLLIYQQSEHGRVASGQ